MTTTLPPLGLYIHLPWCERKCPYCDFNSHERAVLPEQDYVTRLLADLELELHLTGTREVSTVFIGGGTPSLFSARAIERLLQGVRQRLPLSGKAEITMEANPGSAEAERFSGYVDAGVNRLSLGVQSFNDERLSALGRVHDAGQAERAVAAAQAAGFARINIDLMHGLPGQSPEQAVADLQRALEFDTGHLSWYQLTLEPNTAFYKRPPLLPVEDALADIQSAGEALLAAAGYRGYEVSAYARRDQQCQHNRNYWEFGDYLGIGAGAHGKISTVDGRILRRHKTRVPEDYMDAQATPLAGERELDATERRFEFLLNALRLQEGFSLAHYEQRTGLDAEALRRYLQPQVDQGLLCQTGTQVCTTALGARFLDTVLAEHLP